MTPAPTSRRPSRAVDPAAPALSVGELSTQRGDGIFESVGVVDGHAQEVQAHLDRLAHSAEICDLPLPNLEQWREAVALAAAHCGPGRERRQAHPQPRCRSRAGADRLDHRRARRGLLAAPRSGSPRRHAGSRLRQRGAGARTMAASGREDPVVRGEHGRHPRGQAPRRRRRDLRVVRRRRPRSPDRVAPREARRHIRHARTDGRHPAGHHPAERFQLARSAGARRPPTATFRPKCCIERTPRGWCRRCGSPRRSPRSTARRFRSTPTSPHG